MAFFGVCRHGTYAPFLEKQPAFNGTQFAQIADRQYDEAFDAHVLGAQSPEARALQVECLPAVSMESLRRSSEYHESVDGCR